MDDKIWQMFWDLNEKIHAVKEKSIEMETQGNTEDEVQEDTSNEWKWKLPFIVTLIWSIVSLSLNFYLLINYLHL